MGSRAGPARTPAQRRAARRWARASAEAALRRGRRAGAGSGQSMGSAGLSAPLASELAAREDVSRPALAMKLAGIPVKGMVALKRNVAWHASSLPRPGAGAAEWRAAQRGPRLETRILNGLGSILDRPLPVHADIVHCSDLEATWLRAAEQVHARQHVQMLNVRLEALLRGAPWRRLKEFVVVGAVPASAVRAAADSAVAATRWRRAL